MQLKILKFFIITATFLISLPLMAQVSSKTYPIAQVEVKGTHFSDPQTIITISGLRIGDQLTLPFDSKIQLAIKNLWQRKQFSSVEINVDKITAIGIFLIIKIKEFPRLSSMIIRNNDELSEENIKKTVQKSKGDIISPYETYLIKQRVKKAYIEHGLQFATIEPEIQMTDTAGYCRLILDITEGLEFHVQKIIFSGNNSVEESNLISTFEDTHERSWWKFWRSSKFDPVKYKKDLENISKYYKQKGYIDAFIIKDTVRYEPEKENIYIYININEGKKYYVRNISFEGNTIYPTSTLLKRLDFKKGDVYDLEKYQLNLSGNPESSDAKSVYLDNGYLFADMQTEETRVQPDSIDLKIKVIEGNRVTIGRVDIAGNTKTKDKVVRRELYTQPGDYFNKSAVIRSIRALGVLNFFTPDKLRPDIKPVDNTKVDIVYNVEEHSTDQINASVGFAGTFGLTGSIGLTLNNFSLAEPFIGGAGQVFNFSWEFGQMNRIQNLSLGVSEPWLFDEPTSVGFNLFDSRINYNYDLRRTGVTMNIGRRFHWPDDYFRGDWSIIVQRNVVDTAISSYYRPGKNTEITLGQTFSRISVDNLFFPTVGSRFSFSTQFAMGALGIGTTDYFKNSLKFEMAHPLMQIDGSPRLILFLSSYMGYIFGFKSDTTISPVELSYMGGNGLSGIGVTPLRGYEDRSVGPQTGGQVIAKHFLELRFAISIEPPIYFYGFGEAGNVWKNLSNTDPFNLKRSAGLGVQLMINPIGMLGFSYGYGFDNSDITGTRSGWHFLFNLGQQ
jgi:outer membrane protein insertion porin family